MGGRGGEGLPSVSKPREAPNSFPQRILLSSLLELTGGSREWGVGRLRRKNSASSSRGQDCKIATSKLARCLGALVEKLCVWGVVKVTHVVCLRPVACDIICA